MGKSKAAIKGGAGERCAVELSCRKGTEKCSKLQRSVREAPSLNTTGVKQPGLYNHSLEQSPIDEPSLIT